MSDVFSPDKTKAALDRLPTEQAGIGVTVENGDVGVQGAVKKDVGKGWTVAATGQWFKEKGYAAAAWVGWTGAKK